jgi:hypothetical protein
LIQANDWSLFCPVFVVDEDAGKVDDFRQVDWPRQKKMTQAGGL